MVGYFYYLSKIKAEINNKGYIKENSSQRWGAVRKESVL